MSLLVEHCQQSTPLDASLAVAPCFHPAGAYTSHTVCPGYMRTENRFAASTALVIDQHHSGLACCHQGLVHGVDSLVVLWPGLQPGRVCRVSVIWQSQAALGA